MKLRLSERDRQAVDLLLDRTPSVDASGVATPSSAVAAGVELNDSLKSVSAVLSLLGQLPQEAPPSDLVQRTLQRIQESSAESLDEFVPEKSLTDSGTFTI
jgi:hypothetical protein